MILPSLVVALSQRGGRGVFSAENLAAGTLIEVSPVIVMSAAERARLDETLLHDYIFEWGEDLCECAMALGYVALYNHDYSSNAEYEMDFDAQTISVTTVRDIRAGEEICVNYNGGAEDKKPVWFEDRSR